MSSKTGVEIKVVEWEKGRRDVAIHFKDIDTMLTLNTEGARHLAFLLMECADFIEPPFSEDETPNQESLALFGPYEEEEDDETDDSDDDGDDEDDEDEEPDDE